MLTPTRSRIIPQCSACISSYIWSAFGEALAPATALRQQVRGKRKMANNSATVTVRLLRDVDRYGRAGSIVPISRGQMRNQWFPRQIAAYITVPELKTLRLGNVPVGRDPFFRIGEQASIPAASEDAIDGGMSPAEVQEASMFQKKAIEPRRLTPERSVELLEMFVPKRLEFYRQPIIEEPAPEPEPEPAPAPMPESKKPSARFGFGAGAELMAARARAAETAKKVSTSAPAPTGPQAIYGSVSPHDVLVAIRAVMAENDEARLVVLRNEDIQFVDLPEAEGAEAARIKHIGDFTAEFRLKGAETTVRRVVRVIAQEAS